MSLTDPKTYIRTAFYDLPGPGSRPASINALWLDWAPSPRWPAQPTS